jgi:hypothetical protein
MLTFRCGRTLLYPSSGRLRWYLRTNSGANTCSTGSHVLSASGYPFHFTRY